VRHIGREGAANFPRILRDSLTIGIAVSSLVFDHYTKVVYKVIMTKGNGGFAFLITIFTLGFSLSAKADHADPNSSSPVQTNNSRVDISGNLPDDLPILTDKPVSFAITFPGKSLYFGRAMVNSDRTFIAHLPLNFGAGTYTIDISYSREVAPAAYASVPLKTLTAINTDPTDEDYLLPTFYVQSDSPEIRALSAQIIAQAQATSDLEKAKAFHDWVSTHIRYDDDEAGKIARNAAVLYPGSLPGVDTGTALYAIHRGMGACRDLSMVYAALARSAGLAAKVIGGAAAGSATENHAWNEVLVGGNWLIVDTTWDAGSVAGETYFNPDAAFFATTHIEITVLNL
jgi:hypothetical protein